MGVFVLAMARGEKRAEIAETSCESCSPRVELNRSDLEWRIGGRISARRCDHGRMYQSDRGVIEKRNRPGRALPVRLLLISGATDVPYEHTHEIRANALP